MFKYNSEVQVSNQKHFFWYAYHAILFCYLHPSYITLLGSGGGGDDDDDDVQKYQIAHLSVQQK